MELGTDGEQCASGIDGTGGPALPKTNLDGSRGAAAVGDRRAGDVPSMWPSAAASV